MRLKLNSDKFNGWIRFVFYMGGLIFAIAASYTAFQTTINTKVEGVVFRLDKVEPIVSADHDTIIGLKSDVEHIKDGVDKLVKLHEIK